MNDDTPSDAALRCVDVLFNLPMVVSPSYRVMTSYGKKSREGLAAIVEEHFTMKLKAVSDHAALRDALQQCLDLLDHSDVRHYIGTALGEMSQLHKALRESKKVLMETRE